MGQNVGFSRENFKAAIINTFKQLRETILTLSQQIGNLSRGIETMKRNQMEILGLKNRETEMKNSLDELNNDLRGKKKELVNMEIELIKVSILKNREKKG